MTSRTTKSSDNRLHSAERPKIRPDGRGEQKRSGERPKLLQLKEPLEEEEGAASDLVVLPHLQDMGLADRRHGFPVAAGRPTLVGPVALEEDQGGEAGE